MVIFNSFVSLPEGIFLSQEHGDGSIHGVFFQGKADMTYQYKCGIQPTNAQTRWAPTCDQLLL